MNFKKELYSAGDLLDESDKQLYQSLVGSLTWAMIGTRPDVACAIGKLSKFVSKPSRKHLIAAKRVIRYLKFTKDFRLQYSRGRSRESLDLFEYCDASWECQDDGKSEQVICLKLTLVLWPGHPRSILQLLSLYCWSRVHCSLSLSLLSLIWDLGFVQRFPTNTYEDKQSYIAIAKE